MWVAFLDESETMKPPTYVLAAALVDIDNQEELTRAGAAPTVDALLLLFPILFIGSLAGHALRELREPSREIAVHFPETSTLMPGDAVVEQGVPVGRVRNIEFRDGVPVTSLELFHKRPLGADTRFLSISHSLMGGRQVWVVPGDSPGPLDEKVVHAGIFVPSLVDRMHEAEQLALAIAGIESALENFLRTGGGVASVAVLQQTLTNVVQEMDALAGKLDAALDAWPHALRDMNMVLASAGTTLAGTGCCSRTSPAPQCS
jgi:hypothetical protein